MRVFSYLLVMAVAYLSLFAAVQNGFGVTEITTPASAEVAGVSVTRTLQTTGNPLVDLINKNRFDRGLSQLIIDAELNKIATVRGNDMVSNSYYSHINAAGQDYSSLLSTPTSFSCENLDLTDTNNPQVIVQDWLNSNDGHRECLLSSRAVNIGLSQQEYAVSGLSDSKTYITVLILSSN